MKKIIIMIAVSALLGACGRQEKEPVAASSAEDVFARGGIIGGQSEFHRSGVAGNVCDER